MFVWNLLFAQGSTLLHASPAISNRSTSDDVEQKLSQVTGQFQLAHLQAHFGSSLH